MESSDQDPTVRRLRALGTQPVDPDVAGRHQAYLAAAAPVPGRSRMRPLLAGSLLAGALLGGTGLAAALPGSLPEQAGSLAKAALRTAQLADDEAKDPVKEAEKAAAKAERDAAKAERRAGAHGVARFTEGCTTGTPPVPFTGNHGQYVRAHPDDPATTDVNEREVAARSDCGKPLVSLGGTDSADDEATETGADAPGRARAEQAKAEAEAKAAEARARAEAEARARAEEAKANANAAGGARPEDAGRPESPGHSEGTRPPATAENQQGSEHRATDPGNSSDAGNAAENRPEGVGPPTSAG